MADYRIILADDHAMIRRGIKRIIEEDPELRVIGEASDGLELIGLLKSLTPDMVILDIQMPGLLGIQAAREIKKKYPQVKILILSMHNGKEHLHHAISAGADGYLSKENTDVELHIAIEAIRNGNNYISSLLSPSMIEIITRGDDENRSEFYFNPLSTREREVLKLVAEGKSSREIAEMLCISVRTVQHHRAHIMQKLDVSKSTELVRYAVGKGYVAHL